ncbi:MAG TPA: hypothetical protein VH186_26610 [Chloroflexia bacterium]|nr:hypothetical protein [Chloroflexia bacterium]
MAKSSKGLDLGLLIEIAGVVLNSTRNKESKEGQPGGMGIDSKKLAWGLAGVAGQQALKSYSQQRENKRIQKMIASGEIDLDDITKGGKIQKRKKKGGLFRRGLILGLIGGAVAYVLTLPEEKRAELFKQIEQLVSQAMGFVNELQGKPYSKDYEPKES